VYRDCYVTAAVKCAPPGDKPTPQEFANCSAYLDLEIRFMKNLRAVLTLGALSFKAYLDHLRRSGMDVGGAKFAHGKKYAFEDSPPVYLSYHPSPRNTNTGVLTQPMLVDVLERIKREMAELDAPQPSSTPGSI
jgi:uracil-DNA glycosylase family 4